MALTSAFLLQEPGEDDRDKDEDEDEDEDGAKDDAKDDSSDSELGLASFAKDRACLDDNPPDEKEQKHADDNKNTR